MVVIVNFSSTKGSRVYRIHFFLLSNFIDWARRVKPTLLTAIIVVLLLDFETRLQDFSLPSYSLETLLHRIHKRARIIKQKHI